MEWVVFYVRIHVTWWDWLSFHELLEHCQYLVGALCNGFELLLEHVLLSYDLNDDIVVSSSVRLLGMHARRWFVVQGDVQWYTLVSLDFSFGVDCWVWQSNRHR